ncbi:MAG: TSCPD domain-containing protein [Magnetococcales bacterium]|nr:TSCPD domain-containing protein [Magnetococcales bacterium]
MGVRIDQKIVGYQVVSKESPDGRVTSAPAIKGVSLQPLLPRPHELPGMTYKIKDPMSDHALYVTINDILIGEGGEAHRRPFEIFINSKNMENFAWIVALTRVISAVFRQSSGDLMFLVEELRSVFDPRGGYWKSGGKYVPSIVAEIGECIEKHLILIGLIKQEEPSEDLKAKRQQINGNGNGHEGMQGAKQCAKCGQMALIKLEGCDTCLECGYSKCG